MATDNYFDRWLNGIFSGIGATDATPKNHTITIKHQNLNTTPSFEIRNILSNRKKLAFTVVWADGTTTTVHLQPGDEWDDEKALAMCFTKKALGNKGNFNDKFNDALNNKMKVIPGGAGIAPEKECACGGEHPCTVCTCDGKKYGVISGEAIAADHAAPGDETAAEACDRMMQEATMEAMQKAGVTAKEATNAITELIHELSKQNNTNKKVEPTKKRYQVLLRTGLYDDQLLFESDDLTAVKRFAHTNAKQRGHGYYTRLWHSVDGMYIDYGSYSTYYFIPNMTVEEWTGK